MQGNLEKREYVKRLKEKIKEQSSSSMDWEKEKTERKCFVCGSKKDLYSLSRGLEIVEIICKNCVGGIPSREELESLSPEIFRDPFKEIEV